MRRITLWLVSTVSALVLLFSYHTSTPSAGNLPLVATAPPPGQAPEPSSAGVAPRPGKQTTSGKETTSRKQATSGKQTTSRKQTPNHKQAKTFTGDVVRTPYGPVQVVITVAGSAVTHVKVAQVPYGTSTDQEINSQAVPILTSESMQSQSAQIDMVSGATYTSMAYINSLQSALDRAHL